MKDLFDNVWFKLKQKNFQWRYKLFIIVPLIILLVTLDWTTKAWASKHIGYGDERSFIPGFIKFKYIINQGSAYGAMSNTPGLVIFLASLITIMCLFLMFFSSNYLIILTFTIIFSGSFANLFGRIWAPTDGATKNGVIDFLVWDFWNAGTYIFNLADLFVNVGIGFAILALLIYLTQLLIDYYLKRKNEDLFEKYLDLRLEIERTNFEIEIKFWTTRFKNWWELRKALKSNLIILKKDKKMIFKQIINKGEAKNDKN